MTDTRGAVGSYDDLPESEVATVLEVPLVWPTGGEPRPVDLPPTPAPTVLPAPRPATHRTSRASAANGSAPGRHRAVPPEKGSETGPLVHTARIGLISAALVLSGTAAVLLFVAWMLP